MVIYYLSGREISFYGTLDLKDEWEQKFCSHSSFNYLPDCFSNSFGLLFGNSVSRYCETKRTDSHGNFVASKWRRF